MRLAAPENNFAVNIVDLALMAAQNEKSGLGDLDRTVWDLINGNLKSQDRGEGCPLSGQAGVAGGPLRAGGPPGGQVHRPRDRPPRAREDAQGADGDQHPA